jgi:hypothetical protein
MKIAFRISIILNLLFLGAMTIFWFFPKDTKTGPVQMSETTAVKPTASAADASPSVVQTKVEHQPFRWSQLESDDYRTYVKNLRAIGCPETTLRAIVIADVNDVYRQKGRKLQVRLDEIQASSWSIQLSSYQEQQALKAQIQELPGLESAEICELLGLSSAPRQQLAAAQPRDAWRARSISSAKPELPLVLRKVDLEALNLNDQQLRVIADLRQQFIDEIGGPNQDPRDPAYRARWQKAQAEMDSHLRGMLGVTVFEDYQVAASQP